MPPDSDALLRSVRRWLLVTVFLLGLGLVGLANIGSSISNYNGPIPVIIGVIGALVALAAVVRMVYSFG